MKTLYWHDYETFGIDAKTDRPCQFAGVRTDENLEIIGEPLELYCQPATDYLPSAESVLVTGITPQQCTQHGLTEQQFAAQIHQQFAQPGTCGVGYNSIRFDDEFTRFMLYRNFYDPYEREWKNGNSRWDIIDMLRMARALRPGGINWPNYEDGTPSFRLEHITKANGLEHDNAHDALSDVLATIAVAKLLKNAQPQLYNYLFELRNKRKAAALLTVDFQTVLVHTSSKYAVNHGKTALVMPLCVHPVNNNGVVVFDLSHDPQPLLDLPVEELKKRLFTPRKQLPEGQPPVPLKTIHTNRSPAIAPLATMDDQASERLGIDRIQAERHYRTLQNNPEIQHKISQIFAPDETDRSSQDVDQQLYSGGFCSNQDKYQLQKIRNLKADQHQEYQPEFEDARYDELYFRYRAKSFPESLTESESNDWRKYCFNKLTSDGNGHQGFNSYRAEINRLQKQLEGNSVKLSLLAKLIEYSDELLAQISPPVDTKP